MATLLGHPNWQDPERRQSINTAAHVRMSRGLLGYRKGSAWAANPPARGPLIEAMGRVADLIERRREDFWNGESTQPGWALEFTMHGRTLDDAQPKIICSSTSGRCRRNAKRIILREEIVVDDRGIGLEFYSDPLILYGGLGSSSAEAVQNHSIGGTCSVQNAVTIEIGLGKCTGGGMVLLDGEPYLLTVAHTFEDPDFNAFSKPSCSVFDVVTGAPPQRVNKAGTLWAKRSLNQDNETQSFDWALCSLDPERINMVNCCTTPAGKRICPTKIATERSPGTSVYVVTATKGTIPGKILSDRSLFMSPGGKKFQRVCSVVLDRQIAPGDCGSWVLNVDNGDFCGHIVAGKASSTQVYFITAEDIFANISESLRRTVTLPPPGGSDDLPPSPLCQGCDESHPAYWWPRLRDNLGRIPHLFEIMSLGASGGSLIILSAGSFVLKDIPTKNDTVIRGRGTFIDCATATFNCSETLPRCSNAAKFDFENLWNITTRYWQQCPDGPWLFNPQHLSSNLVQKKWLSNDACEAVAGVSWSKYPSNHIWSALTTWRFPLLQLIALSPRPPLGLLYEAFSIIHMLGDPIGTLGSFIYKLEQCQRRAVHWQWMCNKHLLEYQGRQSDSLGDSIWKSCAIITDSYDEWGAQAGDEASNWLDLELAIFARSETCPRRRKKFLNMIHRSAAELAADRSTKVLPIIVGISFFIAMAMVRTSAKAFPLVTSDKDVYSLSFMSLYFWVIPAVILASLIGTSQTRSTTPRILQRFEQDCYAFESGQEAKLTVMKDLALRHDLRIWNGGLYSWQPGRAHHRVFQTANFEHHFYTSDRKRQRRLVRWLRISLLRVWPLIYHAIPAFIVLGATITGIATTVSVPPHGWSCQTRGVLQIFFVWLGSYLLSLIPFGQHHRAQFLSTFIKDTMCFVSTIGIFTATEIGVYNRCSCYTKGGLMGLQLPQMTSVSTVLENGLQRRYPTIITMGILFQLIFIPGLIMLRYDSSTQVYMQRDDGRDVFAWLYSQKWWPIVGRSHDTEAGGHENEATIEGGSGDPGGLVGEKQVNDDMSQVDKQHIEQC